MNKKGKQRPDSVDVRPKDVMFSTAGPTGWAQKRRDITNHKGLRKEGDFSDQHHKFYDPESDDAA